MKKAIAAYDAALGFDCQECRNAEQTRELLQAASSVDKAIADYDAAIAIQLEKSNYFNDRGIAHWKKGDL